ncbi:MAG: hypothetical protein ACE5NN_07890, partial [Candidatus Bathyarchaeia archaeon]
LQLSDTLILFDKNFGVSIFPNFRGYDNLVDDAEWILERNPESNGFILRPVSDGSHNGLWIGEYTYHSNEIRRHETLFDENAERISRLIMRYASREVSERELMKKLRIDLLKRRLKSEIVQDFRYYVCPDDFFYYRCGNIEIVYRSLKEKYGKNIRAPYSSVADDILTLSRCPDVVNCPLKAPNAFERIYNLNRALRSRGIGEIKFVSPGVVRIV